MDSWRDPGASAYYVNAPSRRSRRIDLSLVSFTLTATVLLTWQLMVSLDQRATREHRATTFVELPIIEPGGEFMAVPLDKAEEYASSFKGRRDSQGSYLESAQDIAAAFGVVILWDGETKATTRCIAEDPDARATHVAFFCSLEPYIVYLNADSPAMPSHLYEPGFVDTVKHELAHHAIWLRCGDSDEWEVPKEGLTNSYAVQYLGADRDDLNSRSSVDDAYRMTADTDAAATRVHDGTCG